MFAPERERDTRQIGSHWNFKRTKPRTRNNDQTRKGRYKNVQKIEESDLFGFWWSEDS